MAVAGGGVGLIYCVATRGWADGLHFWNFGLLNLFVFSLVMLAAVVVASGLIGTGRDEWGVLIVKCVLSVAVAGLVLLMMSDGWTAAGLSWQPRGGLRILLGTALLSYWALLATMFDLGKGGTIGLAIILGGGQILMYLGLARIVG